MKQQLNHDDLTLLHEFKKKGEGLPLEEREHFRICQRFAEAKKEVPSLKRNVVEVAALSAVLVDIVDDHSEIAIAEIFQMVNAMGLVGSSKSQYALINQLTLPLRDEGIIDHRKIVDRRRQRWAA